MPTFISKISNLKRNQPVSKKHLSNFNITFHKNNQLLLELKILVMYVTSSLKTYTMCLHIDQVGATTRFNFNT